MLLAMRKEECSVATFWLLAPSAVLLILPDHGCLVWYPPGSRASASTHDDVQVLPCLPSWGPYILHLPYLQLGSLLIHKTSWPLESSRNFSCLLCVTSEVCPSGSHGSTRTCYFCHPKHHGTALPGQMPGSLEAAYTLSRIFPGKPGPAGFPYNSAKPPWGSYYCTLPAAKRQRNRVLEVISVTQVACQPWSLIL